MTAIRVKINFLRPIWHTWCPYSKLGVLTSSLNWPARLIGVKIYRRFFRNLSPTFVNIYHNSGYNFAVYWPGRTVLIDNRILFMNKAVWPASLNNGKRPHVRCVSSKKEVISRDFFPRWSDVRVSSPESLMELKRVTTIKYACIYMKAGWNWEIFSSGNVPYHFSTSVIVNVWKNVRLQWRATICL